MNEGSKPAGHGQAPIIETRELSPPANEADWSLFCPDIVPIIPPDAVLSPGSTLKPEHLGKIPGILGPDGWHSYAWQHTQSTPEAIEGWRAMGAGLGLIGRRCIGLDIDIAGDPVLADAVQALAFELFGPTPCRTGNAPKRLLIYPVDHECAKRLLVLAAAEKIEILGAKQQFVVEGIHSKTGRPYRWDESPAPLGPELKFRRPLSAEEIDAFMTAAAELATAHGYTVKSSENGALGRVREAPEGFEADTPAIIAEATAWLSERAPVAVEGEGGDSQTIKVANVLGDFGLTWATALDLMLDHWNERCEPPWSESDLKAKVTSAYRSRQNEIGCGQRGPAEVFGHFSAQPDAYDESTMELILRSKLPPEMTAEDVERVERFRDKLLLPAGRDFMLGSIEALITELNMIGRKVLSLFRGRAAALAMPAPVMLVDRIIPKGKLILPYGSTGEGKTYFGIEIAAAVAMRRPAFGEFKINLPGDSGVVVIFAGEDCTEIDQSRLVAIEQHFGRSLEGLVFTTDHAIPLTDPALFSRYRDELMRIQDMTGKPIDLILNDTLGRSIQGLKANDQDTGHRFTAAMENLIREFDTTILCSAHDNKGGGGTISGTQVFLDNAPVTPHVEGIKAGGQLNGFKVTMEPKFRVGQPPKPFTVRALPVMLPKPVNGSFSDLVFVMGHSGTATAASSVREKILAVLPTDGSRMHLQFVGEATGLSEQTIANHVHGKREGSRWKVQRDCRDLVIADEDGQIPGRKDWFFAWPMA